MPHPRQVLLGLYQWQSPSLSRCLHCTLLLPSNVCNNGICTLLLPSNVCNNGMCTQFLGTCSHPYQGHQVRIRYDPQEFVMSSTSWYAKVPIIHARCIWNSTAPPPYPHSQRERLESASGGCSQNTLVLYCRGASRKWLGSVLPKCSHTKAFLEACSQGPPIHSLVLSMSNTP